MKTLEELDTALAKLAPIIANVQQNDISAQRERRLAHLQGMFTGLLWASGKEAAVVDKIMAGAEVKGANTASPIQRAAASLADVCKTEKWFAGTKVGKTAIVPHQDCIVLMVNSTSVEPYKHQNNGWAGFIVRIERVDSPPAIAASNN